MGMFKGRFTAQSNDETGGTVFGWGKTFGAPGGPNNNWCSRHCPIALYKGEDILCVISGVGTRTTDNKLMMCTLTATAGFAAFGMSTNGQAGNQYVPSTELPARLKVNLVQADVERLVAATGDLNDQSGNTLDPSGNQWEVMGWVKSEFDLSDITNPCDSVSNSHILAMNVRETSSTDHVQIGAVFEAKNTTLPTNQQLVDGETYDMIIEGDFDRAEIVDWRAFQNGRWKWSTEPDATNQSENFLVAAVRAGGAYPELVKITNVSDEYDGSAADMDGLYTWIQGSGLTNVGFPGTPINTGYWGFDASGNFPGTDSSGNTLHGYYTRVGRILNEDGSTNTEVEGTFMSSYDGFRQTWGIFDGVGIDVERYIYVNGNLDNDADGEWVNDGKSEFSGYASIEDIPAGDLTANALVYVVAGTLVNGTALTQDTVFAVNDGQVGVSSSGGSNRAMVEDLLGNPIPPCIG